MSGYKLFTAISLIKNFEALPSNQSIQNLISGGGINRQ